MTPPVQPRNLVHHMTTTSAAFPYHLFIDGEWYDSARTFAAIRELRDSLRLLPSYRFARFEFRRGALS